MSDLSILRLLFPRLRRAVPALLALLILVAGSRTAFAGAIYLMEGNGGTQDCVFVKRDTDAGMDRDNDLKKYSGTNDEARSARLRYVQPGTLIRVYDAPDGNSTSNDDWTEIFVKRARWDVTVPTFERTYEDDDVKVVFHRVNGLDGKVSRIEVRNDNMRPLVDRRRWMSQHWPLIADKRLIDITLPASHDSGTASLDSVLSRWAITQNLSTRGQLDEGIRSFDFRVEKSGGNLIIHHGAAKGEGFSTVLSQMSGWLADRQAHGDHELVMVTIAMEKSLVREIESGLNTALGPYLFRKDALPQDQRNTFHSSLKLSEILSGGPRVIVLISDSDVSDQFWYPVNVVYDEYANMQDSRKMVDDQQRKYQSYDASKLFLLSWTLTENAGTVGNSLHTLATKANLDLWHLLQGDWGKFDAQGGRRVNLLSMDFVGEASTTDFALALNGWDYRKTDDFWRRFYWSQMEGGDRKNWETLGWSQELWNTGNNRPASDAKKWVQLNSGERDAALRLGYNERAWDLRAPGGQLPAPQTFPVFKELDVTLNPGEWQSWVLEKASLDRAFVAAFSLANPARNAGFLERHAIQPEWDGRQWNTVLRLQVSADIGQPLKAKVRIYEISKLPVAAEFTTDLKPGEWQGHSLGMATTDYAYAVAVSPVGPGRTGDFLEKKVIQPEWDGTQWITALRLQIPQSMVGMKLQVRVYKVADAPVALTVDEHLTGGEWRSAGLGEAAVERAYLTAFSAAKPPINAGFLERHVVQPEWDGQKWISALRTQIPVSLPSLDLKARAFLIRAR